MVDAAAWPGAARTDLAGHSVGTLFFEDSTRTRSSFTLAAQRMGAHVVDCSGAGTSVSKGETIVDTALTIESMGVSALVVRCTPEDGVRAVADAVQCAVISAGAGAGEHPTQGLLDCLTIAREFDRDDAFDFSGLRLLIVGDLAHSRVAGSAVVGFTKLGGEVICCCPEEMTPGPPMASSLTIERDLDRVIQDVDIVMMLRIQMERGADPGSMNAYTKAYQLDARRAALMRDDAIVMHPGPMNREVEIASEVADGPRSRIWTQVRLGVPVRMAALLHCIQSTT